MRGVRPANIEQIPVEGVVFVRSKQTFPIAVMNGRLFTGEEARSDPHSGGTEGKRRCKAATIGNATRCNDGDGRYCIHYGWNEWHRRHRAADMPTCFPALGHNDIDAKVLHSVCLSRAGGGME